MLESIYIKPTRKKCEISDFKTFEILDGDKNEFSVKVADVIKIGNIGLDIIDGYVHIFTYDGSGFKVNHNMYSVVLEEIK